MNYTNEIIRDITDVANPNSNRTLAIADSEKSAVALTTLAVTAGEMGLATFIIDGVGESGEANRFLIVADTKEEMQGWVIELMLVGDGYPTATRSGAAARQRLQRHMGIALGYERDSIEEFIKSEVAATCPCTCCGGDPA
jgi:hypothetical protein